jgi:hypothetical protein
MAEYRCLVPRTHGDRLSLELRSGETTIIVGSNGSGKTRLGVFIESQIPAKLVHRIAAQKSLSLNDNINLISLERASSLLRFGHAEGNEAFKAGQRWGNRPAVHFLSDFDALLQTLFAKHNRVATKFLQDARGNPHNAPPLSEFERLKTVWERLLPHRGLVINEASVKIAPAPSSGQQSYAGGDMSYWERAIFYFLGQCLLAPENAAIIIDEPEAHVHKSILPQLWSSIEQSRPDCSFLYISHDIDFAASHNASKRYFLRAYLHNPIQWDIEEIPDDCGLPEQALVELAGTRKPVLFVEGDRGSVDLTIYENQYADYLVIPIGSCEAVIHSVSSFKSNPALHRLEVRGIVDADDRDNNEIALLSQRGIHALQVSEVENLLLLPSVFLALAELLLCADPPGLLRKLVTEVVSDASNNLDTAAARFAIRQIDRRLKSVEIKAKDSATLGAAFQSQISSIDPAAVFNDFKSKLAQGIANADLPEILKLYDNKGLLARASSILGLKSRNELLDKTRRHLGAGAASKLRGELAKVLPAI